MRFPFPRVPAEFELPDAWWSEAGMSRLARRELAYRSTAADVLPLDEIEPPFRLPSAPCDWHGFARERMVAIFKGFVGDIAIPPIVVFPIPPLHDLSGDPFKYRVADGFHRFYASIAAGFHYVPAVVREVRR
jgi:hypothetical protein